MTVAERLRVMLTEKNAVILATLVEACGIFETDPVPCPRRCARFARAGSFRKSVTV